MSEKPELAKFRHETAILGAWYGGLDSKSITMMMPLHMVVHRYRYI